MNSEQKSSPDILIIDGLAPADLVTLNLSDPTNPTTLQALHRRCKIIILELGYTIEHCLDETLTVKRQQHIRLVRLLLEAGWHIPDTPPHAPPLPPLHDPSLDRSGNLQLNSSARKIHILILGSAGVIFNHLPSHLSHLGIPSPLIPPLLAHLHFLAVRSATAIISKRRQLEHDPSIFIPHSSPPLRPHEPP